MTTYNDKGPKPDGGKFLAFDHVTFYVSNAKQAASYYAVRLGLEPIAYQGLETGDRQYARHVVKQNKIIFVFISPYEPGEQVIGNFLLQHGDGVKDVAFHVENLKFIIELAKERGATIVRDIWEETDEFGTVQCATIHTYGDVTHTLIQRNNYKGIFLPNYKPYPEPDALLKTLPDTDLKFIDHFVSNHPVHHMDTVADWYARILMFHRFWSIDDKQFHTENSASRSVVMTNYEETFKLPINEPAAAKKKSQIQEYVEYNGGSGVQHIGLNSKDIISSVRNLRARGLNFLTIPDTYYEMLKEKLKSSKIKITEDMAVLQELQILVDYDEEGYLLQIFTKNMQDRPTFFMEVIQRHNHNGFGAGNFQSLFQAIEIEQNRRGNLTDTVQ